jgi:hypothetical protein
MRRASPASPPIQRLKKALGRLRRRRRKSVEEDTVSFCSIRMVNSMALVRSTDDNVSKSDRELLSGPITMWREPSIWGLWNLTARQVRRRVSNALGVSIGNDGRRIQVGKRDGVVGHVSDRCFATTAAQRHCATCSDCLDKRRSTYIEINEHTKRRQELERQFELHDNMAPQLGATMVDLESELEWLAPIVAFNRSFGTPSTTDDERDVFEDFPADWTMTEEPIDMPHQSMEGMQGVGSPPELDAGYQTSDSDLSFAEDYIPQHSVPAQCMLEALPMDVDDRFGSFYSVSKDSKVPEPQVVQDDDEDNNMDYTYNYAPAETIQSRFSWDSSVYSDSSPSSAGEEEIIWWKPVKPLTVKKAAPPAPPIPVKNPLRLLRRLSKSAPRSFSEDARSSRNILNLQLDLSRLHDSEAPRSPRQTYEISRSPIPTQEPKNVGSESQPSLALPEHILDAMRNSKLSPEAWCKVGSRKKSRRSPRLGSTLTTHARSRSTQEAVSKSDYAKQIVGARRHARTASEPFPNRSMRGGNPSKWNESMPSHGCIRRSCIAKLKNELRPRPAAPGPAINKQLPPLPVTLDAA